MTPVERIEEALRKIESALNEPENSGLDRPTEFAIAQARGMKIGNAKRALSEALALVPSLSQGAEPVAWARRWYIDGEKPAKELRANGRWAWPVKFKLKPVTDGRCLPDDVPLAVASPVSPAPAAVPMTREPMTWQPIESAPERVRVLAVNALGHYACAIKRDGRWEGIGRAIGWMPLPAAPEQHDSDCATNGMDTPNGIVRGACDCSVSPRPLSVAAPSGDAGKGV